MIHVYRALRLLNLAVLGAPLLVTLMVVSIPLMILQWLVEPLDLWLARKAGDDAESVRRDRVARIGFNHLARIGDSNGR